jgi:hypothetical protein
MAKILRSPLGIKHIFRGECSNCKCYIEGHKSELSDNILIKTGEFAGRVAGLCKCPFCGFGSVGVMNLMPGDEDPFISSPWVNQIICQAKEGNP